jgi:transposase
LADGRCKCKNYGNKYTHRPRYTKLSKAKRKEIARLFWLSVPAAAAAKAVGLSAKQYPNCTIEYGSASPPIARPSWRSSRGAFYKYIEVDESCFAGQRKGKRGRGAGGKIPVFGLLKRGGEVRVIHPKRCNSKHLLDSIL